MRLFIALILATIFVVTLTFLGIHRFYPKEDNYRVPPKVFKLDHLTEEETKVLFAELNIPWDPKPTRPNLDVPTYQNPSTQNNISVVADITVNPDGSVAEVFILGASVDGKYTEQLKAQILQQQYDPKVVDGVAVEYQIEELVELDITND